MGYGLQRAHAATALTRLTERQQQIFGVLTDEWKSSGQIAHEAGIRTSSSQETAAKYANQLTKLYLAEKGGTRSQPLWRRSAIAKSLV